MKIAYLFPGQGSQYVGMGQDLYNQWPKAKELYELGNEVLGFDIKKLCFEGPEEELVKTFNTQPALLLTSVVCHQLLKEKGIKPQYVAGHSLGEYSALVAGGALNFEDALRLVRNRGLYMEEAAPQGTAGMAAILGMDNEALERVCMEAKTEGIVEPANYNSPGQIVISGELPALERAMQLAKEAGAKRVIKLNVSGPFHSSLMTAAGDKLAQDLEQVEIKDLASPLVANFSGETITTAGEIREALVKQISESVRWADTIYKMMDKGVDTFIEVGPNKVLSGLVKKINRKALVLNVENFVSLEKTLAKLEEVS